MYLTTRQEQQRKNDRVQSVLISRDYRIEDVRDIIDLLGYNLFNIDITKNYYRVRQFNPGLHTKPRYKTVKCKLLDGVEYVIEY